MIKLDFDSRFYKNCRRQRKAKAKICQACPFRRYIEWQENPEALCANDPTAPEQLIFGDGKILVAPCVDANGIPGIGFSTRLGSGEVNENHPTLCCGDAFQLADYDVVFWFKNRASLKVLLWAVRKSLEEFETDKPFDEKDIVERLRLEANMERALYTACHVEGKELLVQDELFDEAASKIEELRSALKEKKDE